MPRSGGGGGGLGPLRSLRVQDLGLRGFLHDEDYPLGVGWGGGGGGKHKRPIVGPNETLCTQTNLRHPVSLLGAIRARGARSQTARPVAQASGLTV